MQASANPFVLAFQHYSALLAEPPAEPPPAISDGQLSLSLEVSFPTQHFRTLTHFRFSQLVAHATDGDLWALAQDDSTLAGLYPRSNGSRPLKIMHLLKTARSTHLDLQAEIAKSLQHRPAA